MLSAIKGEKSGKMKSWKSSPCSRVIKRIPMFKWLLKYKKTDLVADIIAGTTVALMVVPQSLAFAAIAGLTPEYGLYSSYISSFIYIFLGTCHAMTIGPGSLPSLMAYEMCGDNFPACVILSGFYAGIIEICMVILQLGWIVKYISEPVVIGFTNGAACTIISAQLKNFFGISGPKGSGFLGFVTYAIRDIKTISLADSILGCISFVALLLLNKLGQIDAKNEKVKRILEMIANAKNIIVLVIAATLAFIWSTPPFKLTGNVAGGFPKLSVPQFNLPVNSTSDEQMDFLETWSFIRTGPLMVALISILQNVSITKVVRRGEKVNHSLEMISLGTCNIAGSFLSSLPVCASFSRSTVGFASGVKTPLSGLFTGIIVLATIQLLTPSFYYIPKASLAAVIITAFVNILQFSAISTIWKISKTDSILFAITFLISIFRGMEVGILVGTASHVFVLLFRMQNVGFDIKNNKNEENQEVIVIKQDEIDPDIQQIILTPKTSLVYSGTENLTDTVEKLMLKNKEAQITLNLEKCSPLDYSCTKSIKRLIDKSKANKYILKIVNCPENDQIALRNIGVDI